MARLSLVCAALAVHAHVVAAKESEGSEEYCTSRETSDINLVFENRKAIRTQVNEVSTTGVAGFTTYRLTVTMLGYADSMYAMFGDSRPMRIPAARQFDAPCGVHIGGANPLFFATMPECQWDSWLALGGTDGSNDANAVSSIGIDWSLWTETNDLVVDNGALFWMDPDDGPSKAGGATDVVIAKEHKQSPPQLDLQGYL